jgi:PAP2 superfamily
MMTTRKPYHFLAVLLTVLLVLSSGTVCGFTGGVKDVPAGLTPSNQDEAVRPFRSLAYNLEDPFQTALSMPTTATEAVSGPTPTSAELEKPATVVQSEAGKVMVPSFGTYVKEFVPDVVGGTKRIFSKDNVPLALIGVGLTGLAFTSDERVKKYFQDRKPLEHSYKTGDTIGSGYPEAGLGFALLGTGELIENKKLADTGVVSLEASLVDGIATEALKLTTRRKRPNGGNHNSFPSGHASITATFAASVSEMYDWDPRLAVPLYVTTAFVAASRIQANQHFLSDVIAGITLGTLVGTSVAKYHKGKNAGGLQNISISPVMDKDLRGWVVTLKFM